MNDRPPPPANAPKPDDEPVGIRCRSCGCADCRVVRTRHAHQKGIETPREGPESPDHGWFTSPSGKYPDAIYPTRLHALLAGIDATC